MTLREIFSRVERLREALEDGDAYFAGSALSSLLDDLWGAIDKAEADA